jgi:sec-independent protein translocase protein TatA
MLRFIGPTELILVLLIVVIVFGVGRLPEVGGALGKGIRDFKKGLGSGEEKDKKAKEEAKEGEAQEAADKSEKPKE